MSYYPNVQMNAPPGQPGHPLQMQYSAQPVASTSTNTTSNAVTKSAEEKKSRPPQESIPDVEFSLLKNPNYKGELHQALLKTADQVAPGIKIDADAAEVSVQRDPSSCPSENPLT